MLRNNLGLRCCAVALYKSAGNYGVEITTMVMKHGGIFYRCVLGVLC